MQPQELLDLIALSVADRVKARRPATTGPRRARLACWSAGSGMVWGMWRARPEPARVAPLAAWVRIALAVHAAVMLTVGVPLLLVPMVMLAGWP
jgi:hypothetical protein